MPLLTSRERIATTVGGYRVERLIGTGGMGVVFEAREVSGAGLVALKLPRIELDENERRQTRLHQEGAVMQRLSHPNIVRVLGSGLTEDGLPYLVMERLVGHTLEVELEARGRIAASECLALVLPILGALAVVHDAGLVHRDLKPRNIFLAEPQGVRRVPKLLDFGIAKASEVSLTETGCAVGTPSYMAPEQRASGRVGPAADVFSVGVVLYRMLSGELPPEGGGGHEPLAAALAGGASELVAAVSRALRPRAEDRYQSMRGFAQALVTTAVADGTALPGHPDPVGLPAYPAWVEAAHAQHSTVTGAARSAVPAQVAPDRPVPTVLRAETTLDDGTALDVPGRRRRRGVGAAIAAVVGTGALAAGLAARGARNAGADAAAAVDSPVAVASAPAPSGKAVAPAQPLEPIERRNSDEPPVPVSETGSQREPSAPASAPPSTPRVRVAKTPVRTRSEREVVAPRKSVEAEAAREKQLDAPPEPRLRVQWE